MKEIDWSRVPVIPRWKKQALLREIDGFYKKSSKYFAISLTLQILLIMGTWGTWVAGAISFISVVLIGHFVRFSIWHYENVRQISAIPEIT